MASTLVALQTVTVGAGGVASVTFSSIPQTYNDLVIKVSARNTYASIGDDIGVTFNGVLTNRTGIILYGTGSAAASTSATTAAGTVTSNTATANTFGNTDIYITNYASSNYKSISSDNVTENNATGAYQTLWASLWSSTEAITSITLTPGAGSWMQYSTFTLYGVYNSASETLPSIPTIGTATDAGTGGAVSVPFTAGATAGTAYTALSTPGSITATQSYSPIVVSGLTNGTAYTFQVKAANPGGESAYSSASNSVTPTLATAWESISTTTVSSAVASVTFSSIPATYQHLQVRLISRGGTSGNIRINSDTGNNYSRHYTEGNGTSAIAGGSGTQPYIDIVGNTTTASLFSVNIVDFLDYANTNKFKTVRNLAGVAGSYAGISSGTWQSTSATTSITFTSAGGNYAQYSTFALYGIRG